MFFGRALGRWALPIGFVGGMTADADVFIPYLVDLELPWTYHRHFTHSLAFIPLGGGIAMLPFMLSRELRRRKLPVYLAATAAFATHGVLDSCTSFGTHLFWPFTQARESWDSLPIAEPLLTLVMLACVVVAWLRRSVLPGWFAALALGVWTSFGFVQRDRALVLQHSLAASRGHEIEHGRVFAMPLSMVLWRSAYRAHGRNHIDAFRLVPWMAPQWMRCGHIELARPSRLSLPGETTTRRAELLQEYETFTDGFVAWMPSRPDLLPDLLGDMRFANGFGFEALWGVAPGRRADARDFRFVSPVHGVTFDDLRSLAIRVVRGDGFEDFPLELLR